jgi:hypothetical protein
MLRDGFLLILAVVIQLDLAFAETPDIKTAPQIKKPPVAQDLFKSWSFDTQTVGETPAGFSSHTIGTGLAGLWKIQPDAGAPTAPNVLIQAAPCPVQECVQILLVEELMYEYPDVAVQLRLTEAAIGFSNGWAGLAFGARDIRSFYATVVDLGGHVVEVIRFIDGTATVLGRAPVKRRKTPWHLLRARRNTTISKEYIEVVFDGEIVLAVEDKVLGGGQIGLVTKGDAMVAFDNLNAAPLYSQKPLSPPAAY